MKWMAGRSQTLLWWLEGGGVKTTETKIHVHWPRLDPLSFQGIACSVVVPTNHLFAFFCPESPSRTGLICVKT